jgi:hypothetical protein
MNERIQELAKQSDCSIDGMGYGEGNLEKFAELIVRECIEQVITGPNGPAHYAMEAALRVKKHFGINSSDNIQAGAEIHSDKGYSESTQEKYQEAKQRREDRREIKSSLGYSRVGMWGRK